MDPEELEQQRVADKKIIEDLTRRIVNLERAKNELVYPLSPQTLKVLSDALSEYGFKKIVITDGIIQPDAKIGSASIYIDTADGDLKIEFGDSFGATIQADS